MKESRKETEKTAVCCGVEDNTKIYMATLFLVGIVLGALLGYGYLAGQKPIGLGVCENGSGGTVNATANAAAIEKATLFLNNEILKQNGFKGNVSSVSDAGAKEITFNISGPQAIPPLVTYLINNTLFVFGPYAVDLSQYTPINTTIQPPPSLEVKKSDKPEVKLFVMSFCPYGQEAEAGIKPVVELLGSKANIEPHFVLYPNYKGGGSNYCMANGSYCSMHGINEVKEDVRQLCIWKYNKEKWWQYTSYVNENCNVNNIETCWQSAANATGVNATKISDCEANEALALLEAEQKLNVEYIAKTDQPSLGSPMLFINNVTYSGGRTPEAYKTGICAAFNTAPADCNSTLSTTASGSASGGCS